VVLASPLSFKIIGGVLMLVIFASIIFASSASYARKETVAGWIAPEGGLIRVAARQGGVVEAINIREGQRLTSGTTIMTLKLSSDLTSGDSGKALVQNLDAEGIAAEAQARASRAKLKAQLSEMISRRELLQKELLEARKRIDILEGRQKLADDEAGRGETLLARGFLSRTAMGALKSTALSAAQDVSATRSAAIELERQIGDLTHEIAIVPSDIALLDAQTAQSRATLLQRRVTTQAQSAFVVTAPIDGSIAAIPVESGQSVAAGAAVAVMMPKGSALTAELYVPSRAIGFIKPGQEVRLLYQAFPYQTFGAARGSVRSISRTVLAPSELAIPGLTVQEPVFRVRVALDRQFVSAYGEKVPLQPGMLLTADVITDRRNLLQWLLDPLYAVGRRA
jgi:membrane fusion protein